MYEVDQEPASEAFHKAWKCAGQYLEKLGGDGINWLRCNLNPPLAEHLSFRIGNQLFFIFIEVQGGIPGPSSKNLFLDVSAEAKAIPAILTMEPVGSTFQPVSGGWGLRDPQTGLAITPPSLVSDERIEMSDWEVHDFAIQIVASQIEKSGSKVRSRQSSLHIDPSLWFQDKDGPAFVVVRSGRFPQEVAPRPANIQDIKDSCSRDSLRGFFASVTVANVEQQSSPPSLGTTPLYRGEGMFVRYNGLEAI